MSEPLHAAGVRLAARMSCSIMITTRNRREELRRTLGKLRELRPKPDEVLVCADGCTDDTVIMVRNEFPECTLIENRESCGSVFSRDRMLRLSKTEIVVSLDDDSYPIEKDFFARVRVLLAEYPKAAVISFPEIRDDGQSANGTKTPITPPHLVSAYPNCAAAMRRDVYLNSPGFPHFFGHMYEEPDYALQCYGLGYEVRFEPSLRIRHHVSPMQRQPMQRHHLNARNELWSVWMRCPFPQVIAVSVFRAFRQFQYACTEGVAWTVREPVWWLMALGGLMNCCRQRAPIVWSVYYAWMKQARAVLAETESPGA
jgi:GT2 family glycosyltransferase